jgi:HEAT repeat protein
MRPRIFFLFLAASLAVCASAATLGFDGAHWIWYSQEANPNAKDFPAGEFCFRAAVTLPENAKIKSADLIITADNLYTLYLNGKLAGEGHHDPDSWREPKRFDVAAMLVPGRNVVAVQAANTIPGWAGLLAKLVVTLADGKEIVLASDGSWRCTDKEDKDWAQPAYDDKPWRAACVLGAFGMDPWKRIDVDAPAERAGTLASETRPKVKAGTAAGRPAPAAPNRPAGPAPQITFAGAKWIWSPPAEKATLESFQGGTVYFRATVEVPANPKMRTAEILVTADNLFSLYVNGLAAAESENWSQPKRVDLAARLVPGRNVIAVEATNTAMGPAGMVAKLQIQFAGGEPLVVVSDASWKCSDQEAKKWELPDFDDRGWRSAHVIGDMGIPPWGPVVNIPGRAERARTDPSGTPDEGFKWPEGIVFLGEDCSLYPSGNTGPGVASLSVTVFTARKSRAYPEHDLPSPIKFARKLFVLKPVQPDAAPRMILDAGKGAIGTPCVSFDGRYVFVSMARDGDPFYHIYRVPAEGGEPVQLTNGPFHDIDPAEMPDGRIVFTSTRIGMFEEYHNPPSRSLFKMNPDGTDIHPITHTFIFDNEAKAMPDGRILFIRSDNFFDRGKVETLLHAVHPDGTEGYTEFGLDLGPEYGGRLRAFYCGSPAPMPDGRVAFVSGGGIAVGWPGAREQRHFGMDAGDVAAMPDGRLLCSLAKKGNYQRIGVLDPDDGSGKVAVVFDGKGMTVHSPAYLGPRQRPPILPEKVDRKKADDVGATGILFCQNARFTKNSTAGWQHVRAIRVLGGKGLTMRSSHSYIVHAGSEVIELGTVPLAPDGSFCVEVPADIGIAFQAVDGEGRSELNEMSWIFVRPGEKRGCVGCHQTRQSTPVTANAAMQAMRTPPLRLLGQGQPHRFRGNNAAVTGMMEMQFDRYREVAALNRHAETAEPLATGPQEIAALIEQLKASDDGLRISSAQRLGVSRDRAAAVPLAASLRDKNREVRVAAAFALAACGTRESAHPLLGALTDTDALVAQAAAVALENLTGHKEPFDPFVRPAERAKQAQAWLDWFKNTPWDKVEQELVQRLASPDRDVVRRAAVALGHIGGDAARAPLRDYVARERNNNPLPEWRKSHSGDGAKFNAAASVNPRTLQAATRALGCLRDKDAVAMLAETLTQHADPAKGNLFLAEAAAEALGAIGTPDAEDALIAALPRLKDYIQFTRWYGDHDALMACHASPIHYFITEALDALGSTKAGPIIPNLLRSVPTDTDRALFAYNDDCEALTGRVIRRCGSEAAVVETCLAVLGDQQAARTKEVEQALGTHGAWGGRPDPENRAAQILSLVCRDTKYEPRIRAAFERYRERKNDIPRVFSTGIPVVQKLPVKHWVCFFLARAMGNLARPESTDSLIAALEKFPPEATEGSPDPTGPGVLFLHNDLTPCWRAASAWALGRIADKRAAPALLAVIKDLKNAPDVRHAAAEALGKLADKDAVDAMRQVAADYPEYSTRRALLRSCAQASGQPVAASGKP